MRLDAVLAASQKTLQSIARSRPYSTRFATAMVPTALTAVLLCSGTVWRSALLRFIGFTVGGLFMLAGLLSALNRTPAATGSCRWPLLTRSSSQ